MQDFQRFKDISLRGSQGAALRETKTLHGLEYLTDGGKATFEIENYLGGVYYLTADEILQEDDKYVIQESKNATLAFLPSVADIKDGLFKLILFSNLDSLTLDGKRVQFKTRLKLTGRDIRGSIRLPCSDRPLKNFMDANAPGIRKRQQAVLEKLNWEARNNKNLEVEVERNQ